MFYKKSQSGVGFGRSTAHVTVQANSNPVDPVRITPTPHTHMTLIPQHKLRAQNPASSRSLAASCSLAALALLFSSSLAQAQNTAATTTATTDEQPVVLEQFVVSGMRSSLIRAQEIKQNSVQLVDSIVAEDIGKLPDNTVAEALQRVPGIQVGRGAGEVSSVLIRGLPNIGTTLNGHEIFTGVGRGVALQDLPAELIAGVDIFKTNAPDQIEGGIAGLIDIRLRKPLDFKGFEVAGGARGIYGDNAKKNSYTANALVSNRWKTGNGGEFGALVAASYQKYHYQDQTIFNFDFEPRNVTTIPGQTSIMVPATLGDIVQPGNRARTAYTASFQWKPTSELELYSDLLYTNYRNRHALHFFIGIPSATGTYTSATLHPGTNVPITLTTQDNFHLTSTQSFTDRTDGYQVVGGARWNHNDLHLTTEYVYNWSSVKHRAFIVDTQFNPSNGTYLWTFNRGGTADASYSGPNDMTSANNYALWGLFDNHDYATSHQGAWRADATVDLNTGLLSKFHAGLRATTRSARFRATSVNDVAPAAGRGVTRTSSIPGFGSLSPDAKGSFGVPHWYGGDPDFLLANREMLRPLFGQPAGDPGFAPANSFTDKEKTYAAYAQVAYAATPGGRPLDGIVGFRVVKTDEKLGGNRVDGTPITGDKDDTQVLPVINARLKLTDRLQLRGSAGRSITRPDFNQLNPVVSLTAPTTTGTALGTGNGGNPDLSSVKSDNYDVALEYYFSSSNYASLTGFYRSIDGYVQTFGSIEQIDGIGYVVTRPRNSGKGHLDGLEATYQHFFETLPGVFKGIGLQTNFTYIEGSQDVPDPAPGAAIGARVRQPYTQVSKYNYNIIGIYEHGPLSARLAYNWRGKFIDTFNGPNAPGSPLRTITVKPTKTLDFSLNYELRKGLTVTFDITNALNNKYQDYFGPDANLYPRDTRYYDRTYALGVRYRY
jgi:TonB-dependent receptor